METFIPSSVGQHPDHVGTRLDYSEHQWGRCCWRGMLQNLNSDIKQFPIKLTVVHHRYWGEITKMGNWQGIDSSRLMAVKMKMERIPHLWHLKHIIHTEFSVFCSLSPLRLLSSCCRFIRAAPHTIQRNRIVVTVRWKPGISFFPPR